MKPMLAHKWKDHKHKLTNPIFVQPKLNGIRMLAFQQYLQSRDEHLWQEAMLPQIRKELSEVFSFGDNARYIFDGEIYVHGWSLQQINGAGAVNRKEPNDKTLQLEYHIFDLIDTQDLKAPFSRRSELLESFLEFFYAHAFKHLRIVNTIQTDHTAAEHLYRDFKLKAYEGMMYRSSDAPYGLEHTCGNKENRWACLLKRKEWEDEWFPVVGANVGEGKNSDRLGSLVCQMPDYTKFNVGTGYSDAERELFWLNPPSQIHVQYEMLSDDGTPLKPIYLEAR